MSEINLANLSIKESPEHPSDTHSSPPTNTAPSTSSTTPTQIFKTQLYTSITTRHTHRLSPHPHTFHPHQTLSHSLTPNSLSQPSRLVTLNLTLQERPINPSLPNIFTNPSLDTRYPDPLHPLLRPSLSNWCR